MVSLGLAYARGHTVPPMKERQTQDNIQFMHRKSQDGNINANQQSRTVTP